MSHAIGGKGQMTAYEMLRAILVGLVTAAVLITTAYLLKPTASRGDTMWVSSALRLESGAAAEFIGSKLFRTQEQRGRSIACEASRRK